MPKVVLVIGAGASGLASIKECLDEGLTPVCFEADTDIGGLWRFQPKESHSSVYRSTVINTSKEMMSFSDFRIPDHYPPYMHHTQIIEYFRMYAKHFNLEKYIQFETKVQEVRSTPDHQQTGQWNVIYTHKGETLERVFDAVLVCSGHHWDPKWPNPPFPGSELFKGAQVHSHSYKDPTGYENKNVVIVGIGNSGVDLAVELSRVAKSVQLSTRSGAWLLKRVNKKSLPSDLDFSRRFISFLPLSVKNFAAISDYDLDLKKLGLQPSFPPFSAHPTINGELPGRIIVGAVKMRPNILKITEDEVIFEDGVKVPADVIIYATGYNIRFPFLHPDCGVEFNKNEVNLYKYVFPANHKKPTMAFLGLVQPLGAIMPISEMQVRWATRVFSGKQSLPSRKEMEQDIKRKKDEIKSRYKPSERHTIQVDYVEYMDELAKIIGVYPPFLSTFFKDPKLALDLIFSPCIPPQYRLVGPHSKPELAIDAIKNAEHRSYLPLQTRVPKETKGIHPRLGFTDIVKGQFFGTAFNLYSKL